jgi:hypothetical protein
MDMLYVHIAFGFIACLITASWGYRAGRDIGIEIGKQKNEEKFINKLKKLDNRIQELKKG